MINNPNLDNKTKNNLKLTIIDNYSEIFNSLLDKNSVNEYEINDNNFDFINNSYKNMFNLICSDYHYDTKQNYVVSDNYIFNEFAIKFGDFIKFNNTKNLSEENKNKFIDDVFVPYFNSAFLNDSLHKNDTTNSEKMIKIIDEFDMKKIKENLSNTNLLKVFIRWSDKIQYDINNENNFSTIKINRSKDDYQNLFIKLLKEGENSKNENVFYSLNKNDISNRKTILGFNKVDYSNDFKPIQFSKNREFSIYEKVHFNENSLIFNVYNLFNTKFNDETSLPMLKNEFEIFDYVPKKITKDKQVISSSFKELDGNQFTHRLNDTFLKFIMDLNYKINLNMNYYNNLITNHLINKSHLNNYNFLDAFSEELYKNQQNETILENKVFKDYLFLTTLEFASNKDEIINKIKKMDMSKDLDLLNLRNECDYDLSSKNYNIKYMSCILKLISDCDTYFYHKILQNNPDLKDILNKFEDIINENNKNLYNENTYTKDLIKFFNNNVNDGNYVLFENLFNYAKNENFSEEKLLKTLNTVINNHRPFFVINKTILTSDFNKVNECLLNNDNFEEQNDLYSFMVCLNLINSIKSEKYPEFNNVMKKVLDKHMNMTNLDISMEKLTEIINNRNVGNKETSIHNLDKLTKEIKSNYVKSQNVKEKARQHYKI